MKKSAVILLVCVLLISFVSAGWFSDFWSGITGHITYGDDDCDPVCSGSKPVCYQGICYECTNRPGENLCAGTLKPVCYNGICYECTASDLSFCNSGESCLGGICTPSCVSGTKCVFDPSTNRAAIKRCDNGVWVHDYFCGSGVLCNTAGTACGIVSDGENNIGGDDPSLCNSGAGCDTSPLGYNICANLPFYGSYKCVQCATDADCRARPGGDDRPYCSTGGLCGECDYDHQDVCPAGTACSSCPEHPEVPGNCRSILLDNEPSLGECTYHTNCSSLEYCKANECTPIPLGKCVTESLENCAEGEVCDISIPFNSDYLKPCVSSASIFTPTIYWEYNGTKISDGAEITLVMGKTSSLKMVLNASSAYNGDGLNFTLKKSNTTGEFFVKNFTASILSNGFAKSLLELTSEEINFSGNSSKYKFYFIENLGITNVSAPKKYVNVIFVNGTGESADVSAELNESLNKKLGNLTELYNFLEDLDKSKKERIISGLDLDSKTTDLESIQSEFLQGSDDEVDLLNQLNILKIPNAFSVSDEKSEDIKADEDNVKLNAIERAGNSEKDISSADEADISDWMSENVGGTIKSKMINFEYDDGTEDVFTFFEIEVENSGFEDATFFFDAISGLEFEGDELEVASGYYYEEFSSDAEIIFSVPSEVSIDELGYFASPPLSSIVVPDVEPTKSDDGIGFWWWFIIILLLIGIGVAGYFIYKNKKKQVKKKPIDTQKGTSKNKFQIKSTKFPLVNKKGPGGINQRPVISSQKTPVSKGGIKFPRVNKK